MGRTERSFRPRRKWSEGRAEESSLVFVTWCDTPTKPQVQRYVLPFQAVPPLCRHTPCSANHFLWLLDYALSLTAHKVCPDTPTRICKSSLLTCALCLPFVRVSNDGANRVHFSKAGFRLVPFAVRVPETGV